VPTKC